MLGFYDVYQGELMILRSFYTKFSFLSGIPSGAEK